jgi:hypothetical protein
MKTTFIIATVVLENKEKGKNIKSDQALCV